MRHPDLGARRRRGFSPELPRATWSRPNSGIFFIFSTCVRCKSPKRSLATVPTVASPKIVDLRPPQVDKCEILPEFGRDPVARGSLGPLRRRTPNPFNVSSCCRLIFVHCVASSGQSPPVS
mmetsp:Transcript_97505/g.142682  ORF Transcript_97505/g.142682 Transcript_97505/m.142682 type:complete len:121 (+) Transcript_97505:1017-1379(+)